MMREEENQTRFYRQRAMLAAASVPHVLHEQISEFFVFLNTC